jgi:hypothetical protein
LLDADLPDTLEGGAMVTGVDGQSLIWMGGFDLGPENYIFEFRCFEQGKYCSWIHLGMTMKTARYGLVAFRLSPELFNCTDKN